MKLLVKVASLVLLGLGVAGCATVETPSRNAPLTAPGLGDAEQVQSRSYDVQDIRIAFPGDLRISESNGFYPIADIVWRGDPIGDRRQQIGEIMMTAFTAGTEQMEGDTPVVLDITVRRFHSLTERTRYSVGGVHSIFFDLTVRHAETGVILEEPRRIDASFPALGGQAAIRAENAGQTQKVRITDHLTYLIGNELSATAPGPDVVVTRATPTDISAASGVFR